MNKKAGLVLALALLFGGITALSIKSVLNRKNNAFAAAQPKRVVVAASPISLGSKIKADQIQTMEWPENLVPHGSFGDVAKTVDRVAISEYIAGEPILESRLAPEGSTAGLSAIIPEGSRAITVRVDEVIGVAGFIAPGTYVDVIATSVSIGGDQDKSNSKTILQNVKVLASGQKTEVQQEGKDGKPVEVKTVTLQVSPEQAEVVALAATAGKLQLVMRNTMDQATVNTSGTVAGDLFTTFGSAAKANAVGARVSTGLRKPRKVETVVAAPPQNTIELIRGSERTTITIQ